MKLSNPFALVALAAGAVLGGGQVKPLSWGYLNELTQGPVDAPFKLTKEALGQSLDRPQVMPRPNATSFDWWYFDAFNPANINESVVIIFYLTTNTSFPLRMTENVSVSADVFLNFKDGSAAPILLDSAPPRDGKDYAAIVTSDGAGTSAAWPSVGMSFTGYSDGKRFIVNVDNKKLKLSGHLEIKATAPSRYPCSMNGKEGENLEAASHIGWTNIIPDATADADVTFGDKRVQFTNGIGYHDKKWGDRPFHHSVKHWYWGHARLGAYSIVWLETVGHDGKTFSNAYISHPNGSNRVSCLDNFSGGPKPMNVHIENSDQCSEITFTFEGVQQFKMRAEKTKTIGKHGPFARWTGKVSTTLPGGQKLDGHALFQEFHF